MNAGELLEKVTEQFKSSFYFGVPLSEDGPASFTALYDPQGMVIVGDGHEMPSYVGIFHDQVWVADDGSEWEEVTEETGGLQILALLDPRQVLRAADPSDETNNVLVRMKSLPCMTDAATSDLAELGLLEHGVEFGLDEDGALLEMIQADVTPGNRKLTLRFHAGRRPPWS